MVDGSSVQSKVEAILTRDDLKREVEISHYTLLENDYGDDTEVFDSQSTAYGVVLNYRKLKKKYDQAGLYKGSSLILLLPISTSIADTDIVTVYSTEYDVVNIDKSNIGEVLIHQIVFLQEKAD